MGDLLQDVAVLFRDSDTGTIEKEVGVFVEVAERTIAIVRRTLVEECCAGVVVMEFWRHVQRLPPAYVPDAMHTLLCASIPIAQTIPPLGPEVAAELAERPVAHCPTCGSKLEAVTYGGGALNRDQWESTRAGDYYCTGSCVSDSARSGYLYWWRSELLPPFAASWSESGGVRTYWLASPRDCSCVLPDYGAAPGEADHRCPNCSGTGARTNVKAIADRYQPDRPWRDEDTARAARFEVRR